MNIKKFVAALLSGVILLGSSQIFAAANPFADVPKAHWAYNAVTELAAKGINEGYGDGTFRGERNITRYEAATLLAKYISTNFKTHAIKNTTFSDVPKAHWAYDSVQFTAGIGLSEGYSDGTFRGDKNITRYELATMIANFLELAADVPSMKVNTFSDIPTNHWAAKAVSTLAAMKITDGYGDGTFRGDKNITRYETAAMIFKTISSL